MLGRKMTWWSGLLGVSTSCQLGPEAAVRGAAGEGGGARGASQSCTSGSSGDLLRRCRGRRVRLSARQNWSFLFGFFFLSHRCQDPSSGRGFSTSFSGTMVVIPTRTKKAFPSRG